MTAITTRGPMQRVRYSAIQSVQCDLSAELQFADMGDAVVQVVQAYTAFSISAELDSDISILPRPFSLNLLSGPGRRLVPVAGNLANGTNGKRKPARNIESGSLHATSGNSLIRVHLHNCNIVATCANSLRDVSRLFTIGKTAVQRRA